MALAVVSLFAIVSGEGGLVLARDEAAVAADGAATVADEGGVCGAVVIGRSGQLQASVLVLGCEGCLTQIILPAQKATGEIMHARLSTACFSTVWAFTIAIEEFWAVLEQSQIVAATTERPQGVRLTNCVAEDPGSRIQPLVLAAESPLSAPPSASSNLNDTILLTVLRFAHRLPMLQCVESRI